MTSRRAACTSSSDNWAACQPVLAVTEMRTYRVRVAGKDTVTVFPEAGLKV
ncbi:hypothetical protein GCM10020256_70040 [Streptomyces thermocoprophilus]